MLARALTKALIPKRLVAQLALLLAICMLPSMLVYGWYVAYLQSNVANELTRSQAETVVKSLASNLATHLLAGDFIALEKNLLTAVDSGSIREVQIIDHTGKIITDVVREPGTAAKTRFRKVAIIPPVRLTASTEITENEMIFWRPLLPNGALGWIRAVYSVSAMQLMQQNLRRNSLLFGITAVAISVFLLVLFLKPRIRTLQGLNEFADRLEHRLGEHLPVKDEPAEITALAHALNSASTHLHKSDQALKTCEERVKLLLESTAEAIYCINENAICTLANPACARMLGHSDVATMVGQPIASIIRFATQQGIPVPEQSQPHCSVLQTGEAMHADFAYVLGQDNRFLPIQYWAYPIRHNSTVTGAVVTFFDITEQKNTQQALWESEKIFRDMAENIQNVFWMASPDHRQIIYVSPAYEGIFGRTCQSLHDDPSSWLTAIHPDDRHHVLQAITTDRVTSYDREYRIVRPDNTVRWIRDRAFPVYGQDGELRRITGIAVDITARIEAEAQTRKHQAALAVQAALEQKNIELETTRLQAQHASRVKMEFLANMTHEIRTPMNAIIGFTQLLGRTPINDAQRSYINTIEQSAENLLRSINNILDFSKLEVGKLAFQQVPFSVHECINYAFQLLEPRAAQKGLDLVPLVNGATHQQLIGDPGRIKQVLIHLIDNSIKFTVAGNVVVRVSMQNETDSSVTLYFSVTDTGIGIEPEHQARLFSAFSQLDSSTTRKFGGTGLGLAICKKLVEQMHGQLGVESHNTTGAAFWFTIPCAKLMPLEPLKPLPLHNRLTTNSLRAEAPTVTQWLKNMRVLIADDNEVNRRLLVLILQEQGADVMVTENGQQAMDQVEMGQFEVVILDIHMPVLNGIEAAKRLRQRGIATLIIGLTADALVHNRDDVAADLFDDLFIKPFNFQLLIDTIVTHQNAKNSLSLGDQTSNNREYLPSPCAVVDGNFDRFASHKDRALARDMLMMLQTDLAAQQAAINTLIASENYSQLKDQLHNLQGTAAYCGLPQIHIAAKDFEALLAEEDFSIISTAAKNVANAIEKALDMLPEKIQAIAFEGQNWASPPPNERL